MGVMEYSLLVVYWHAYFSDVSMVLRGTCAQIVLAVAVVAE